MYIAQVYERSDLARVVTIVVEVKTENGNVCKLERVSKTKKNADDYKQGKADAFGKISEDLEALGFEKEEIEDHGQRAMMIQDSLV